MNQTYKTLYRSRNNRIIGGVAAGIGEYLGIDPTVVRLLFVFIALIGWVAPAVVVYLVMLFVVPEEPITTASSPTAAPAETIVEAEFRPATDEGAGPTTTGSAAAAGKSGSAVFDIPPVEPEA